MTIEVSKQTIQKVRDKMDLGESLSQEDKIILANDPTPVNIIIVGTRLYLQNKNKSGQYTGSLLDIGFDRNIIFNNTNSQKRVENFVKALMNLFDSEKIGSTQLRISVTKAVYKTYNKEE